MQFDTSEANHGAWIGRQMVYIQWQTGPDGSWSSAVWPDRGNAADAVYPAR
jgi:hypothetical protein